MSSIHRVDGLEIDQDLDFQRRTWRAQRAGWTVMVILALAALLGLLGPGPLSNSTAGNRNAALWLEFHRFIRYQAPTHLRIHLRPAIKDRDRVRVWFNRDYLEAFQIQAMTPPPESVEVRGRWLIYVFRVFEPSQPTAIMFYVEPEKFGSISGSIGLGNGSLLTFSQFVYP